MDVKKIKTKLNKKMNPLCVWVILAIMVPFLFISYNVLFEPSFMPAPIMDFSKKVVGAILGDKAVSTTDNNPVVNNNRASSNNSNQTATVDTSNWQTYENKELGFSIKYPGDMYSIDQTDELYETNKDTLNYILFSKDKVTLSSGSQIFLTVRGSDINFIKDSESSDIGDVSFKNIVINGSNAIEMTGNVYNLENGDFVGNLKKVFIESNRKVLIFTYLDYSYNDKDKYIDLSVVYENMLKTIKYN